MGVLTFQLSSSLVEDAYSNIDIIFNGSTLASNVPLTADSQTFTYNVDIPTGSDNTVGINVLNPLGSGAFDDGRWSEVRIANLSAFSYSLDSTTFIQLLPQTETTWTLTSGPGAGNIFPLQSTISYMICYLPGFEFEFNTDIWGGNYISSYKIIIDSAIGEDGLPTYANRENWISKLSSDGTQVSEITGNVWDVATSTQIVWGPGYTQP